MQRSNEVKTAVLMPTYNRPDTLKDTLSYSLNTYKKFNFDVYVFDSSESDESSIIVKELQKTHTNLHYIRLCSYIHLDCKWLAMVQGLYLKDNYNYYYVCSDSNALTEYSLEKFYPYMKENYDIINLNDFAHIDKTTEYNNANDYFNSSNMNVGLWGGVICNQRIFNLSMEEWNDAVAKWFKKDDEYIGYVGFILERLSKLDNLKIIEPEMNVEPNIIMHRSQYKKISHWRLDAVKVLGITYPAVFGKLPEIYTNTNEKLLKMLRGNFSEDTIWWVKRTASFNLKNYFQYKKILDKFDPQIMNKRMFFIALLPGRKTYYKLIKKLIK